MIVPFAVILILFCTVLIVPFLVCKGLRLRFVIATCLPSVLLSLLMGTEALAVSSSLVLYAMSLSLLSARGVRFFVVCLLLGIAPFFIHFGGIDLLSGFNFYPLLFDPVLVISNLGDFDILRSPFSYKYTLLADYIMFNPHILLFCLFYMVAGLFILLLNYVIALFKTGAVQKDI